jgi:hypothetical protein
MCYSDGGSYEENTYSTTRCPSSKGYSTIIGKPIDCGEDTYFDAAPEPGSWLDEHWNVAGPENPFLVAPPKAVTEAPVDIQETSVDLRGTVNPEGYDVTYYFEYGTTKFYGTKVSAKSIEFGAASESVEETLEGLEGGETYHFRVVAENDAGTTYGEDETFTTPRQPAIAAYSFNEAEGTVAHDDAGNHDGALEGGAAWTASGKYGGALSLDGTNDLVKVADANELDLTNSFTLEAWVRPNSVSNTYPVASKLNKYGGAEGAGYALTTAAKPVGSVLSSGTLKTVAASESKLSAETWAHLAFTSDGETLRLYVDGTQVASASAVKAQATSASLEIGHAVFYGFHYYFKGLVDELRIFDEALTQKQVAADMAAPVGGPIAAYSFNETEGETVNDATGNHDGTLEGGAAWTASGKYGGAIDFDGTNDLVRIADASDLDLTGPFTLEAWVRPESSANSRAVLSKTRFEGGISGYQLYSRYESGGPGGNVSNTGTLASVEGGTALPIAGGGDPPTAAWSHLSLTFDGANLRLYVGGELIATKAAPTASPTINDLLIGRDQVFGSYFDGRIDEVRVYDRALSQAQVKVDGETGV